VQVVLFVTSYWEPLASSTSVSVHTGSIRYEDEHSGQEKNSGAYYRKGTYVFTQKTALRLSRHGSHVLPKRVYGYVHVIFVRTHFLLSVSKLMLKPQRQCEDPLMSAAKVLGWAGVTRQSDHIAK